MRKMAMLLVLALLSCFVGCAHAASEYETLKPGCNGQAVLDARIRLYELGYFRNFPTQTEYTRNMMDYVKKFEKDYGLKQDGILSPEDQEVLFGVQSKESDIEIAPLAPTPVPIPTSTPTPTATPLTYTDEEIAAIKKMAYIDNREFGYNEQDESYYLRFAFKDAYLNCIQEPIPVMVSMKITDSLGNIVCEKTTPVTANEYSICTSNNPSNLYMGTVTILPQELTAAKSAKGTVSFKIWNDYFTFADYSLQTDKLPYAECVVNLPKLPTTVSENGVTMYLTDMSYDTTCESDGKYKVRLYFTSEKIADKKGNKNRVNHRISWRLIDSEGYIVKEGLGVGGPSVVGDKFKNDVDYVYDLEPGEYTLVLQYEVASSQSSPTPTPTATPAPISGATSASAQSGSTTDRDLSTYTDAELQELKLQVDLELKRRQDSLSVSSAVSDFEYVSNGSVIQINKYVGKGGNVVIPNEIDGLPVTRIGTMAFKDVASITSVVFPDKLEFIASEAFNNAENLTGVLVFPSSLKKIEHNAFDYTRITGVILLGDTSIEFGTFNCNEELEFVYVADGCTPELEYMAFYYCEQLKTVILPASVRSMEAYENSPVFFGSNNVIIYTPAGSYAEQYAKHNFIKCNTEKYDELANYYAVLYGNSNAMPTIDTEMPTPMPTSTPTPVPTSTPTPMPTSAPTMTPKATTNENRKEDKPTTNYTGETFSIRNGIYFGMNMEDVCNAERTYGTSIDGGIEGPQNSDYNPTEYFKLVKYAYVTLMDYPQSVLSYYFDSNDELMSIGYVFGIGSKNPPDHSSVFSEMKELLVNKYGTPYNENDFLSGDLATSMLSDDIYDCALLQSVGMGAKFFDLNQWIVEYSDYYVLIDLYNLKLFSSTNTYLGYRILSPEELAATLQAIDAESESKETKRQKDI